MRGYVSVALVLVFILFLIPFLPTILSLKPLIVLSSSMTPLLGVGDVVIVKPVNSSQLDIGDVIAFEDPAGRENVIITHRIINITEQGFKTKGDAVEDPDQFTVKPDSVVGKAVFDVPYLGYFFDWAKKKEGFLLLILIPSALIIGDELRKIRTYTNPLLEARARKRDEKKIKLNPKIIHHRRILAIFLTALAVFSFFSLPYMMESGYQVEEKTINAGLIPASIVLEQEGSSFPQYELLTPFTNNSSSYTVQKAQFVSVAPGSFVYWHKLLAFTPQFPAIAYTIFPSLLVTLFTIPLWRRPMYQKKIKNKRRLL